jgi:hypothetical protein
MGKIGKNIIKKFFSMGGISIFYRKKIKIYMSYFAMAPHPLHPHP